MSKRKAVEEFIITYINKLIPNKSNEEIYKKFFSSLDDNKFKEFIQDLKNGTKFLIVFDPNFSKNGLDLKNNLKIGKELGIKFFQKIWFPATKESPKYLTPIPYMVIDLPVRRQSQLLSKKMSVPEDNNVVDLFTGQPAGESKGAKISYPELQVITAMGLDNSAIELIKMRGGDVNGYRALNMSLKKLGHVDLNVINQYSSGVESTRLLRTLLTGCHLKNNL